MSALAGLWNFDGRPGAEAGLKRMLAAQASYGPHDERRWSEGDIAMGRRLFRTLPEDRYDRQPLLGADGALALVADVRLDNREELARALELEAGEARQLCDAALLLRMFERWGEGAVERIVGDFAFALWDRRSQKLMLARDCLGQRPLHYHCGKTFFAFGTMPKGLHALPDIPYEADEQAVAEFVMLIPEGEGRSFFNHIAVVKPGHLVIVTRGGVRSRRYWVPTLADLARPAREDFAEGLRHHLDEATRARLRGAEGAVASQLSGGLDSAAVTATAARLVGPEASKVVAFTAVPREGYDKPAFENRIADEGPLAAAVAALYPNIEHVLIRTGERSPLEAIDRNFYLFDRPMLNLCNWAWGSAICSAARDRGLSILLTGYMGNMTLSYAGIELLPELLKAGRLASLVRLGSQLTERGHMRWRGVIGNSLGPHLPTWLWSGISSLAGRAANILDYAAIRRSRVDALSLSDLARKRGFDASYRLCRNGLEGRLGALQRTSFGNYNKGVLAGWGIEQRDPTADKRLIEYCLGVPMDAFLSKGEPRALARRALADRLPQVLLNERRKGYQAADWHEGMTAARDQIEVELSRMAQCGAAARLVDIDRLRILTENWPEGGWHRGEIHNSYRLALLRGVSAGHFLRKASGANQ